MVYTPSFNRPATDTPADIIPFGGMGMSGNGSRFGGEANYEAFTEWQWVTVRDEPKSFPHPY